LDIALCEFSLTASGWDYEILQATTIDYDEQWQQRLREVHQTDAMTFWRTHVEYGHFLGIQVKEFLRTSSTLPSVICSHGHTVFHQPISGFTMQLGAGDAIAAETGLTVVSDFRSGDVALGGQGAPLVPMGDRLLFGKYGACLNLGGFTNISFEKNGKRIAFDICPSNIVLNRLAGLLGEQFDRDGLLAANGKVNAGMLRQLNKLPYYYINPPKSLGREWLENEFLPMLDQEHSAAEDLLRTCIEHIGQQVGRALEGMDMTTVLVTGGGAHNVFLMKTIRKNSLHEFILPDRLVIDFKEALVFAFLGVLRITNRINILSSVTGSSGDHSGGALCELFPKP
jgi:anhydro-N-acetylmuramic acid kinase